jgi:hypothetical protein
MSGISLSGSEFRGAVDSAVFPAGTGQAVWVRRRLKERVSSASLGGADLGSPDSPRGDPRGGDRPRVVRPAVADASVVALARPCRRSTPANGRAAHAGGRGDRLAVPALSRRQVDRYCAVPREQVRNSRWRRSSSASGSCPLGSAGAPSPPSPPSPSRSWVRVTSPRQVTSPRSKGHLTSRGGSRE